MKTPILILAAVVVLVGCEQQDLPRRAAVYDREIVVYDVFEHLEPQFIHGKEIVESFSAKVVGVTDGDTIKVLIGGNKEIKVRLDSIDCPEKDQPFGNKAKQATSDLVFGKKVAIQKTGEDRYGRTLAFVVVDGVNVCEYLVENGWAWNYEKYSKSKRLAQLHREALLDGRGLWAIVNQVDFNATPEPIPPWAWRKKK